MTGRVLYNTPYYWRGHRVEVCPGARIRRISDRGTLDCRAIDVVTVTGSPGLVGLSFTVAIAELEEVPR